MHSWISMPSDIPDSRKDEGLGENVELSLHPDLTPMAYAVEHGENSISLFFRYPVEKEEPKDILSLGTSLFEIGKRSKRIYGAKLTKYNKLISAPEFSDEKLVTFTDRLLTPLLTRFS